MGRIVALTAAVGLVFVLVLTGSAVAQWQVGTAVWTEGSDTPYKNPECDAVELTGTAPDAQANAKATCNGGFCDDEGHESHTGYLWKSNTGYRQLTCACPAVDEPGDGTSTAGGLTDFSLDTGEYLEETTCTATGEARAKAAICGAWSSTWSASHTGDYSDLDVWEPSPTKTSSTVSHQDYAGAYLASFARVDGAGHGQQDNLGVADVKGSCNQWVVTVTGP